MRVSAYSDRACYLFWAKTDSAEGMAFKSVPHHCADVAATALVLQRLNARRAARDAQLTGLTESAHIALCGLLAGLHDIGKISRRFQFEVPELWPEDVLGPCPSEMSKTINHWQATALLLNSQAVVSALAAIAGPDGLGRLVVAAIAGHHGRAPIAEFVDAAPSDAASHVEIGPACVAAAAALAGELVTLLPVTPTTLQIEDEAGFSFALNGLITLSDWIGSDASYFTFEDPGLPLVQYWPLALERAERAVKCKGLAPAVPVSVPRLDDLSRHAAAPRPMQRLAVELAVPAEPQIIVIEDGTGSGKTEAALLLAARMMVAGLGEGLFLAMPTMATANAMHQRLDWAMKGLFDGPASLVLAHGRAELAKAMARDLSMSSATDEAPVSAWCDAWVTDSRKTALFASAGAGTIDQTFLSILPKKHLTLRQYALAGRVLVIDEAHACDAYMGEELKTLIEMQARLGGSVIVLSATLTHGMREDLVVAFARGRGLHQSQRTSIAAAIQSEAYPLLTRYAAAGGAEEHAVASDPDLGRSVAVKRIASREDVIATALEAARTGAAVAIICNAVDPAIATFEALRTGGADPERTHLFHARFAMGDRIGVEREVQGWFGRASTEAVRRGRILVATQVIEQSLDVDFDLMFSDLAPADLLVQRAGRLWRHRRDDRPVAAPVLHVLTPDPGEVNRARWLDATLGPAAFVYDMPGALWRTARDLLGKGRLETPGDLRTLIEKVYSDATEDLPEPLRAGHDASVGKGYGRKAHGRHNTIVPEAGYTELTAPAPDEEVGTRDGERSVTLRLARFDENRLVPFRREQGISEPVAWALSEVTVRASWLQRSVRTEPAAPSLVAAIAALRAQWPDFNQTIPVVVISEDEQASGDQYSGLQYCSGRGLQRRPSAAVTGDLL